MKVLTLILVLVLGFIFSTANAQSFPNFINPTLTRSTDTQSPRVLDFNYQLDTGTGFTSGTWQIILRCYPSSDIPADIPIDYMSFAPTTQYSGTFDCSALVWGNYHQVDLVLEDSGGHYKTIKAYTINFN